jgi:hypothetical protein
MVTVNWLSSATGISKFSLTYGYQGNRMIYGIPNLPSSSRSITIGDLAIGQPMDVVVQAWRGGCEETSNIGDPIIF